MNVLGEPIDEQGEIGAEESWSIHRPAQATKNNLTVRNY